MSVTPEAAPEPGSIIRARIKKPARSEATHRAVLGDILAQANASPRKPKGLGDFSVTPHRVHEVTDYGVRVRAKPISSQVDLEFCHLIPFRSQTEMKQSRKIEHLLDEACAFMELRNLEEEVGAAREMAQRLIGATASLTVPMRVAATAVTLTGLGSGVRIIVDLEMLREDLTLGVEEPTWFSLTGEITLEEGVSECVVKHCAREAWHRKASAAGSPGWIAGGARQMIEAASLTIPRIIEQLRARPVCLLVFERAGFPTQEVSLRWVDGVITSSTGQFFDDWQFVEDSIQLRGLRHLPETVMAALPGRRLRELIESPLLPLDTVITSQTVQGDSLILGLATETFLIGVDPKVVSGTGGGCAR